MTQFGDHTMPRDVADAQDTPLTERSSPSSSAPPDEGVSMLALTNVLLRHRRLVVGTTLIVLVLIVSTTLLWPRTWSGSSSFIPQSSQSSGSVSQLASQFGLSLPAEDPTESPAFYVDLITSRSILSQAAAGAYPTSRDSSTRPLVDILEVRGKTTPLRHEAAMRRLLKSITTRANTKTNMVTLTIRTSDPVLAVALNRRVMDLLSTFNIETRRTQAGAERAFTASRVAQVASDRRQAEDRLLAFLDKNRNFRDVSHLAFERERLEREVGFQQQIYTTLAQALEKAKIDEVRNTPVFTVVDQPVRPVKPDSRQLGVRILLGLIAGFTLGSLLAFWSGWLVANRALGSADYVEFDALRSELKRDLRQPGRLLRPRANT